MKEGDINGGAHHHKNDEHEHVEEPMDEHGGGDYDHAPEQRGLDEGGFGRIFLYKSLKKAPCMLVLVVVK